MSGGRGHRRLRRLPARQPVAQRRRDHRSPRQGGDFRRARDRRHDDGALRRLRRPRLRRQLAGRPHGAVGFPQSAHQARFTARLVQPIPARVRFDLRQFQCEGARDRREGKETGVNRRRLARPRGRQGSEARGSRQARRRRARRRRSRHRRAQAGGRPARPRRSDDQRERALGRRHESSVAVRAGRRRPRFGARRRRDDRLDFDDEDGATARRVVEPNERACRRRTRRRDRRTRA